MREMIDAHIHLDQYTNEEIHQIITDLPKISCTQLIAVSTDFTSSKLTKKLADKYLQVKPAFGFHPEQPLPTDTQLSDFFTWLATNKDEMVAIGEVGLPYYLRKEAPSPASFPQEGYIELLDQFLQKAKQWNKPLSLHAVYEDAPIVCDLLEKHSIEKAHFHWFKGDSVTVEWMIKNGYSISITPDVVYEQEIQKIVQQYPLSQMMVETDGPWRFDQVFSNQITHPRMIHKSVEAIAHLKKLPISTVYHSLHANSTRFFNL